jgi:hypothetical protein
LARLVPSLANLMRTVFERLDHAPAVVSLDGPEAPRRVVVGKFDLQRATPSGLGSSQAIRGLPALF